MTDEKLDRLAEEYWRSLSYINQGFCFTKKDFKAGYRAAQAEPIKLTEKERNEVLNVIKQALYCHLPHYKECPDFIAESVLQSIEGTTAFDKGRGEV